MKTFITKNGITIKATRRNDNPQMEDSAHMDHWDAVLAMGGESMHTYFSMGSGHNGKAPEAADVLDCLASDASGIENAQPFEDWAGEYGYNEDSRKAEKIYYTCITQSKVLKSFLGNELYNELLWDTERL